MTASASLLPSALLAQLATAVVDELERRGAAGNAHPPSPWLTTDEAAEYLRANRQRVFDLTSQRKLPVHKDGTRNLYRREDLDAYLTLSGEATQ